MDELWQTNTKYRRLANITKMSLLSDFQTLSTIPNPFHQLILLKSKPYGLQSLRPSKSVFSFFQQMYSANLVKLYYIVRNCLEQEQSIVSQVSIIT